MTLNAKWLSLPNVIEFIPNVSGRVLRVVPYLKRTMHKQLPQSPLPQAQKPIYSYFNQYWSLWGAVQWGAFVGRGRYRKAMN